MEINRKVTNSQQLLINIVAQLLSFGVNIGIGFFLTPYIINTVGSTSYGFVGLANNFVSYVQILTTALNSMAGRFIAISFYKKNIQEVKKYYTSVLYANILLSVILTLPCTLLLLYMDKIINIPTDILLDVRILWGLIFGTMLISIIGSVFNNAAYVMNRLELVSLRTIESNIIKACLLIGLFSFCMPRVWYVGIASLVCTVYVICVNYYYTKKLMPIVKIKYKFFDLQKIKELISSGIWNSVNQLGNILSTGLDLFITNLFVGSGPMGIVSVSKTIPMYVQSLFITVSSVFSPQLTISFAKEDKVGMRKQLAVAMKIMGLFASIPIAIIISYGESFYKLWVPKQNSELLMWLTCAAVLEYPISLLVYPLENVFSTANKVRILSVVTIIISGCSCLTVLVALQFTDNEVLKMLIVVGSSCVYNIIKNGVLIPYFSAKVLDIESSFFYKLIMQSIVSTVILSIVAIEIKKIVLVNSWIELVGICCIIGLLGIGINFFFLLDKEEQKLCYEKVKRKLDR